MWVIVTGDRRWYAPELAEEVLSRLIARYSGSLGIVHGAATGIEQARHPARWEDVYAKGALVRHDRKRPYNANAGPMRNEEMVSLGADMCLAVHRSVRLSKGTRDCALKAIEAGIPTYLTDSDEVSPRRLRMTDLI